MAAAGLRLDATQTPSSRPAVNVSKPTARGAKGAVEDRIVARLFLAFDM
jgi:hypothetical protein